MISAQLSAIETQPILGGLASKIAMGGERLASPPHHIWGWGISTIKNSCSKIEHNWSTIESTRFDIKILNGGGGLRRHFLE